MIKEIVSWITAAQYAEYHEVLNPKIDTAITTIDLKNVFISKLDVGKNKKSILY